MKGGLKMIIVKNSEKTATVVSAVKKAVVNTSCHNNDCHKHCHEH